MDRPIPLTVRYAYRESSQYFPTALQQFQFFDKYSRFNYDLGRRETWVETVDRAVDYLRELSQNRLSHYVYDRINQAIREMRVMPSMRLLAMAGPAARRNNLAIYNCAYMAVDSIDAFVEALIISMSGCGVGYSAERHYVEKLPQVLPQRGLSTHTHVVEDTTEGWAAALRVGIETWFAGGDVQFDLTQVRPAGTPLRIKGGRASGPEPLRAMLAFVRSRILARQGSRLRPIDAHDIMCSVGNAAVSGGVRRTALISLFSSGDDEMLQCKSGDNLIGNEQRWNANNSVVWAEEPTWEQFEAQFDEMVRSGRGEPGFFSRVAANDWRPERRAAAEFGTNPCGEIALRSMQLCNLTAAIARAEDTYDDMADKVEVATIIGTIQSMATNFPGLRPQWQRNCEEERLLGVDITGQMDAPHLLPWQRWLLAVAQSTNVHYAQLLGINPSAAITCVKPSGNTSQLVNCSSGLHARWAPYYIRNVRVGAHSPIYQVLRDAGAPMVPENGQAAENATTWVVQFPVRSPEGAITRNDHSALEQCEIWLQNKMAWTEHNPSCTITYRPHEVEELRDWVWDNRHVLGGMSFLPASDAMYDNMPYVEISREEYERRAAEFPAIDFSRIYHYEQTDLTNAAQELACVSGLCEI
jgi:ribonucleoside-diphosphate reductase alpha chain